MLTKTTYTPNHQTLPIKTKSAGLPILLITLILIVLLFYFFYSTYPKTILTSTPFLLLIAKEAHRLLRLKAIKKHRYSTEKPYAWKTEIEQKVTHSDYKLLKDSFSILCKGNPNGVIFLIERVTLEDHQAKIYETIYKDLKKEHFYSRMLFSQR